MSVPINQQKQLIEKYFDLLVKEFITDPRHNKNISIVFTNHLKSSKEGSITLGQTGQSGGGSLSNTSEQTTWEQWTNGEKVPGSEKTTTTTTITYLPYKYVITFLNNYENMDQLRGTVVHEFTHLYLFANVGNHDHDSRFYSTMEWLEDWLNKNQGLSPRVDKSRDRDQYEDNHSESNNDEENACPECSYPGPHHSPQCPQNQNKSHPTGQSRSEQEPKIDNESQKTAELNRLRKLLNNSQDLANLESVYQDIKISPFYQGENCGGNKKTLDRLYQDRKNFLQYLNNHPRFSTDNSDPSNKSKLGSREYLLIGLAVVGIICLVMIGYLLISNDSGSQKPRLRTRKK